MSVGVYVVIRHPPPESAGDPGELISLHFPGFRVSPTIVGLARNDSIVELRNCLLS